LVRDHHPISARPSLSCSGNTLLDQTAAKISIDQATVGALDRFPQARVSNPFTPSEFADSLSFENPHRENPNTTLYNTMGYTINTTP
jgi:hypothetical protein